MKAWQNIHPDFRLNGSSYSSKIATEIEFLTEWLSDEESVAVTTSGSTGTPKTIFLEKEKMIASAKATGAYFNLPEKTTALHCLSTQFIAGKMMLIRAMVLGWHLEVIAADNNPLLQTKNTFDFAAMVPLQVQNSLQDIDRIKKLIIGGAAVSKELENSLQSLSTEVYSTYGMTETITHIAVKKLNHKEGKKVYFEGLSGVFFETDSRNCLMINAPHIFDEKIKTNDVVSLISKTNFEWLGRFDHVINSGGVKIHPERVEEKLAHVLRQEFFIASLPDTTFGEKVILVIKGSKENVSTINFSVLNKYEIPKEVYYLPQFVYTENGKLQRQKTLKNIPYNNL